MGRFLSCVSDFSINNNPYYSGGSWFKASTKQIARETLSRKNPSQKQAGEVVQTVKASSQQA
jgi:hypothetical protein